MALKATIDTLEAVEEPFRGLYSATEDGKFQLAVEGMAPTAKVNEFRDRNIALGRELDTLKEQFKGVDLEKIRGMQENERRIREGELIAQGKVDQLFEERLRPMQQAHETALSTEKTRGDAAEKRLGELVIDGGIREAAMRYGVKAEAIEDVLLRGRSVYRMVDGEALPLKSDGTTIFGSKGGPLSIDEWVASLATEKAKHLFEPSRGGGSTGGRPNQGGGAPRIARGDNASFLANVGKIAAGEAKVI